MNNFMMKALVWSNLLILLVVEEEWGKTVGDLAANGEFGEAGG